MFMVILDGTAMNVAMPGLMADFQSSMSVVQWTITGYALAQAAVIPLAGWMSDRHGRRPVAIAFAAGFGVVTAAFYSLPGVLAPLLWILLIFGLMGTTVTLQAYGAEMFPTSQRSTASGVRAFATTLGIVTGLAAVSALFALLQSNWTAILVLASGALVAALLVWGAFPETAGRPLEEIAPEPER